MVHEVVWRVWKVHKLRKCCSESKPALYGRRRRTGGGRQEETEKGGQEEEEEEGDGMGRGLADHKESTNQGHDLPVSSGHCHHHLVPSETI